MALSRSDLEKKLNLITGELIQEKGYICYVDVFQKLGYLDKTDYEAWRMRKIPYLEKSIKINFGKINFILKQVEASSNMGKLKASFTAYKSWGKGSKIDLRFTKSGSLNLERVFSTHFVKRHKNA
ncbi:hypothetical protein [Teredinibacter franksiae]|uniref:hypothetical protein n=1 Tax=Teredinibacter franksiae TaxID=2761453 RepID=UPI001628632F|nr:hypothetical protein [Teredinibacter franksiae]